MQNNKDTYFFAHGTGVAEFKCYLFHKGKRLLTIDVQKNTVNINDKEIKLEKFVNLIKLVK